MPAQVPVASADGQLVMKPLTMRSGNAAAALIAPPPKQPSDANPPSLSLDHTTVSAACLAVLLVFSMTLALAAFASPGTGIQRVQWWSPTGKSEAATPSQQLRPWADGRPDRPHTLVMYAWSNSDAYYHGNLEFFVERGVPGCEGCRYVIIINEDEAHLVRTRRH